MLLPARVAEQILSFPEHRMGAHRVTLLLRDGRRIPGVVVAWGNDVVSGVEGHDFDPEDVVAAEDQSG
jgi:hypothetical protein